MVRTKQDETPSNGSGVYNILATGTTVTGSIYTEADFRLDGRIEGDINCKGKIVVGPRGSIVGNITSDNAEIFGEIEGSIKVKEKLVFKSTAKVKGDIFIQTIEIEPGAHFNGTCTMSSGKNQLEHSNKNVTANAAK